MMTFKSAFLTGYSIAALFCAAWWVRGFYLAMRDMNAGVRHEETSEDTWEKAKKLRVEHPTLFVVVTACMILAVAAFWPVWLVSEIRSSR